MARCLRASQGVGAFKSKQEGVEWINLSVEAYLIVDSVSERSISSIPRPRVVEAQSRFSRPPRK